MTGGAGGGAVGQFPALMAPLGAARGSRRVGLARGKLPPGLRGYFLRNGPDSRLPALFPEATHWFDGDGMVHWVRLPGDAARVEAGSGAEAEYGSAYIETQGYLEEECAGKAKYCGLLQSPILPLVLWGFWSKIRNAIHGPDRPYWVIQQKNTANNGLLRTGGGRLLATYEAGSPYELRLVQEEGGRTRLETVGVYRPGGGAGRGLGVRRGGGNNKWLHNFTAHAKVCPTTKELIFISYDLIGKKFYVGIMGPDDELRSLQDFDYVGGTSTMMHDFAITESRIVVMNHPLNFNLEQSMKGGVPFTYDRSAASHFGIIDRNLVSAAGPRAAEIQWIPAENCYCYHSLNCWDDPDDCALLHLYAHRTEETGGLGLATFLGEDGGIHDSSPGKGRGRVDNPQLHKWSLRTGNGAQVVESRNECTFFSDFPDINPQFVGRPCRFGYSLRISETAAVGDVPLFDAVLKHDLKMSSCETLPLEKGRVAGDITFVPDESRATQEDGGWILFMSHSLTGDQAWLDVIDAADFTSGPVASIRLPHVPIGFHSTWVPEATADRAR